MVRGVDPRNVLIVGFVGSLLSTFFLNVHHVTTRNKICWTIWGEVLTVVALEVYRHGSTLDKTVLCLSRKQGIAVLEIFTVVNNSQLKGTAKIRNSKISFGRVLTTVNIYKLLKP